MKCGDRSLYTGITTDVTRRFAEHKAGNGSHYTRARGAIKMMYTEKLPDRSSALKREAAIKKMPRVKKLALVGL